MPLSCFPDASDGKASAYHAGDPGSIPGSGKSPREGNGYPFQYYCLENPRDRGAWRLQSQGSQRIGHNRATNTFAACFPFGNRERVFYVCESASVLWKSSFASYLLRHLWVILYNACLSLSELLHSVWLSVGPSMLSQVVLFLFMAE